MFEYDAKQAWKLVLGNCHGRRRNVAMDKDRGTNGPGPSPGDFPIGQLARIVRSGSRVNTRSSVWRFQKSEPRMYNQPRREGQTDTCETSIELKNLASRQTSN
ncbi:predicted protein [Histoplasma capsulatum H143]|uniref:Uncharacterized protein n=1 Tax=Ajellomyces capsulatus (strain H143) TaxID=544712 RepID=C6HHC0_AJECH|nr:predicted protein [Histoplasma capsulatum H143]